MTQNKPLTRSNFSLTAVRIVALGAVAAMVAAAVLAFANSAPTRVPPIDAAPLAPSINPCNTNRPAGVWFPQQVEAEFARQCDR